MTIEVYDAERKEWRVFEAEDLTYKPACGNNLHQFYQGAHLCACGLERDTLMMKAWRKPGEARS